MATTELARESANRCLNLMMCGIGQNEGRPLYPMSAHFQEQLFDLEKLEAYSASGALMSSPAATVKAITEESIEKFAKSYATSVGASGSYGFPCGAAVSGSVTADFKSESSSTAQTKFVQIRMKAQYASMKLPKKLMRAKLRNLLDKGAKEAIDAVASPADAEEVIETFGPVYMHAAVFGAILVCSTKSTSSKFTSAKKLETAMTAEIEYLTAKGSASAKFVMGSNKGKVSSSVSFEVSAIGGEPGLILDGKKSEWIKSAGQNLNIIGIELRPISELALKGSEAEDLLLKHIERKSLGILEKFTTSAAVVRSKEISKVLNGTYSIWNKDGNRHPNKFLHVRGDGYLQLWGDMSAGSRRDGNRRFKIEPYKIIDGDQTYVIWNGDGSRHPNKYMHVREDGYIQVYGPLNQTHRNDCNRHFVIKEYKVIGGQMTYLIWNKDGNRHPNQYVHVAGDGKLMSYGPMNAEYTADCNRHFVIEPYKG